VVPESSTDVHKPAALSSRHSVIRLLPLTCSWAYDSAPSETVMSVTSAAVALSAESTQYVKPITSALTASAGSKTHLGMVCYSVAASVTLIVQRRNF
jgi:hypothetical protein